MLELIVVVAAGLAASSTPINIDAAQVLVAALGSGALAALVTWAARRSERPERVTALNAQTAQWLINELQEEVGRLNDSVAVLTARVAELTDSAGELTSQVATLRTDLASRDAELAARDALIADLRRRLSTGG